MEWDSIGIMGKNIIAPVVDQEIYITTNALCAERKNLINLRFHETNVE